MTDLDLLVFGCVVSFVAACGVYVYARESFLAGTTTEAESRSKPEEKVHARDAA